MEKVEEFVEYVNRKAIEGDYDVRFIYVRPKEDYLSVQEKRDVIEWQLDDVLDMDLSMEIEFSKTDFSLIKPLDLSADTSVGMQLLTPFFVFLERASYYLRLYFLF